MVLIPCHHDGTVAIMATPKVEPFLRHGLHTPAKTAYPETGESGETYDVEMVATSNPTKEAKRKTKTKRIMGIVLAISLIALVGAVSAVQLLKQNLTPVASTNALAPGCSSLTGAFVGTTGFVQYGCGSGGTGPAFNNLATTSITVTPIFNLAASSYDSLYVQTGGCTAPTQQLTNNTATALAAQSGYFYCAHYAALPPNGASLTGMDVSWNQ